METLITREEYLSIMDLPADYRRILRHLHKGADSPVTCKELQLRTGFSDVMVRNSIAEMVTKYGVPITGGTKGYYIFTTEEQRSEACRSLRGRASEIHKRANAIENMNMDQLMVMLDEVIEGQDE
jgi:uncharacterized protein YbjQ (UPF0145 family)